MAPDFRNVEVSTFYAEVYHKEKVTGVKWFEKNRRKIERNAIIDKEYNTLDEDLLQVLKIQLQCHKETVQAQRLRAENREEEKMKLHSKPPQEPLKEEELFRDKYVRLKEMMPIEKEDLALLYEPKCRGRNQYLAKRNRKIPEERYIYKDVTSWDYGWKLNKANLLTNKMMVSPNMNKSLYRPRGVEIDPCNFKDAKLTKPPFELH